jgi:hypothetical protein
MSKKTLIFLLTVFIFLMSFSFIFAQDEPAKCCKIKRTFTLKSDQFKKDQCAAETEKDGKVCGCTGTTPTADNSIRCVGEGGLWTIVCALSTIYYVTDWIFYLSTITVGLMIIIGAFLIITSAGDAKKWQKGKDVILYAIIGLVVALLSKFFPSIVKFFLGVS